MENLKQIESKPLGFDDLVKLLGPDASKTNMILYNNLKNKNFQSIFNSKPFLIILMQIENPDNPSPVGHFIILLNYPNYIEHFDPYGLSIEQELAITHEPGYIYNLLKSSGKKYIENDFQFQNYREDVQTCGRWTVARAKLGEFNLDDFKTFFQKPIQTMDDKVSLLTYFPKV